MQDHLGDRVTLERAEVAEARKSLGAMMSGDCCWKAEEVRPVQALNLWQAPTQAGHLLLSDAWHALQSTPS